MTRIAAKRQNTMTRADEQSTGNKQTTSQPSNETDKDQIAKLIAELTKNYIETQGEKNNSPDQDMMSLLQKISNQLDGLSNKMVTDNNSSSDLQSTSVKGNEQNTSQSQGISDNSSENSTGEGSGTSSEGKDDSAASELQALFSRLLQDEKKKSGNQKQNDGQSNAETGQQQKGEYNAPPKTITAKTAAQALAQAQYELSTELEANLKKLKQVISDSEKLANKISNLLGEENTK